jgi:uncharacterized phage-associated protein
MAIKNRQRLDLRQAVEALLYVAARVPDLYHVLKVLYFADRSHLGKYGRFIYGDTYVAMQHGPVPSAAYDLAKEARGDGGITCGVPVGEALAFDGNSVRPLRKANLDLLSESERDCLDEAINQYGDLSFSELRQLSHDAAFQEADVNDIMSFESIARSLPDSKALLEYLRG